MDDLLELRAAFTKIDKKDPAALRYWFESHPHLTTNDHAQIADSSSKYIRTLKKRAGLTGTRNTIPPRPLTLPVLVNIQVPENWRTDKAWLQKAIQLYSVNQLAKATGKHRRSLDKILKDYQLKPKTLKESSQSKNKCCSHEWCHRHYVILGYSQDRCAKLAGIRQQTFADWLNRFKIPIRDCSQTRRGRRTITFWERRLIHDLRKQPVVRRIHPQEGYIHVRYRDYFWENYHPGPRKANLRRPYTYFQISPQTARIDKVPIVYPEYGMDIDGRALFPAHIAINRLDFGQASLMEKRLALHEFARQIVTRGWVWPKYPEDILAEDFDRVKNFNMAKYLENGGFTAIPILGASPPGRQLMMHYFDTSQFWDILRHPKLVVKFLNQLAERTVKFNFFNLILTVAANERQVVVRHRAPRLHDPVVYHAIFKRLGLTGTVLDLNVGFGNRALACAAAGLNYTTPDPTINGALDRGLADFTGLRYEPYTGQKVDTLIYDEGWRIPQMDKVMPYLGVAKKMLVFAPHSYRTEMLKYNPRSAIRLRTRIYGKTPDLVFVW
jgi:hypothetical protein